MRTCIACLVVTLLAPSASAQSGPTAPFVHPADASPERRFDFWLGQWDVRNRFIGEDGTEQVVEAEALIWPALDGQVVVEHWRSLSDAWPMRGFSMRSYDPERDRWTIALCWPGEGPAKINLMEGRFRNGRAEFFPASTPDGERPRSRFTFSDAGPNSLRWDLAVPVEGDERAWRTTWVMEWTRRDARHRLHDLHGGGASENAAADWIVGNWFGEMTGTAKSLGHEFDTLDAKAILNGRAILLHLFDNDFVAPPPGAVHADPIVPAREHLGILAWDRDDQLWRLCIAETGARFTMYEGQFEGGELVLTSEDGAQRYRIRSSAARSRLVIALDQWHGEEADWVEASSYVGNRLDESKSLTR